MYFVYKIVNSINDKVYVGRTTTTLNYRWKYGHLKCLERGDTRQLYCAMRKYGVENFHIELIEQCASFDDMVTKEAYYCQKYEAYTKGYNMTTGGEINPMECEKSKTSHDKKMRSLEVRQKISKTMKKLRAESGKNIRIHQGKIEKRISEDQLTDYLEAGWEVGSGQVGKVRMYNPATDHETSVWEDDVPQYSSKGWILGSKPNRISKQHREILNKSHYKKVQAIILNGQKSPIFENLKEACEWWYNYLTTNDYTIINRAHQYHYALADIIKKSNKENKYIYNTLWLYIQTN